MTNLLLLLSLFPNIANAYPGGRTGDSTDGCGSCHGSSADPTTEVSFQVPSMTVAPGETVAVELHVASPSRNAAGLDVSASDGALEAGPDTQLADGEITHVDAKDGSAGLTTFAFSWTAPAAPGTYTLFGAGNAVDGDGGDGGDGWNLARIDLVVAEGGGADPGDTGAGDTGAGDSGDPSDSGDTPGDLLGGDEDTGDDAGEDEPAEGDVADAPASEPAGSGSCSVMGGAAGSAWALLLAGLGLVRRRRA